MGDRVYLAGAEDCPNGDCRGRESHCRWPRWCFHPRIVGRPVVVPPHREPLPPLPLRQRKAATVGLPLFQTPTKEEG